MSLEHPFFKGYISFPFHTKRYGTVPYGSVRCGTIPYGTVRHGRVHYKLSVPYARMGTRHFCGVKRAQTDKQTRTRTDIQTDKHNSQSLPE